MSDMMICAQNLNKQYGDYNALTDINFDIKSGEIVGLLGPNGAGKTTLLRSMLGLLPYTGQISICGINPKKERLKLLEHLCFISDVATLPNWMSVEQAIQYVDGVHPRFDKKLAEKLIRDTNIQFHSKVSALSKGMVTQLHLALVMAIDAKVLILDEPTLGLDIVNRKHFYTRLLENYFDENKTIIISTHQIEEIQHIISELMIINDGKIVTKIPFNTYADTYIQLQCGAEQVEKAKALNPIFEQKDFNGYRFIYENTNRNTLQQLGVVNTPDISDVFIATIKKEKENT